MRVDYIDSMLPRHLIFPIPDCNSINCESGISGDHYLLSQMLGNSSSTPHLVLSSICHQVLGAIRDKEGDLGGYCRRGQWSDLLILTSVRSLYIVPALSPWTATPHCTSYKLGKLPQLHSFQITVISTFSFRVHSCFPPASLKHHVYAKSDCHHGPRKGRACH